MNKTVTASEVVDKVIISEMCDDDSTSEDSQYEVTFHGAAEEYGFSDSTDYLNAVDAFEIAEDVAGETGSVIIWEGSKPGWAG